MTDYGLTLVTGPAEGPVSLAEARDWCRAPEQEDNALLTSLLAAALERAQHQTGRKFVTQSWRLTLPCFPAWEIYLPLAPVTAITSVVYTDAAGATQTVDAADYELSAGRDPAVLQPVWDGAWPSAGYGPNSVRITFVVGHAVTQAVPEAVKQGMRLYVAHFYVQRGDDDPARTEKALACIDRLFAQASNGTY